MTGFQHRVHWDPSKAASNQRKHGISFSDAATVLLDPLAKTIPDVAHSDREERWVTIGRAATGMLLLVVHTWRELENNSADVRLISARKPSPSEKNAYLNHE
jgi:uncharacterized DUF497 family protein